MLSSRVGCAESFILNKFHRIIALRACLAADGRHQFGYFYEFENYVLQIASFDRRVHIVAIWQQESGSESSPDQNWSKFGNKTGQRRLKSNLQNNVSD